MLGIVKEIKGNRMPNKLMAPLKLQEKVVVARADPDLFRSSHRFEVLVHCVPSPNLDHCPILSTTLKNGSVLKCW
jgi:hypothetical protein